MAKLFKSSMQTVMKTRSKSNLSERLSSVLEVNIEKQMVAVEKYNSFLATVGSTAPFIGLFGTVWGIMNSFQSIGFKLKSSKNDPKSEINVTPFVDVMLVLLIIFMVTAPLLTVGVQVDLPETSADTLPEENEPLTLTINSKGEIFIQETKVEFNNLIVKILAVSNNRTDTRIYVRGDKAINYGRVLEIMGMLSGSGFTKVALISEPNKER